MKKTAFYLITDSHLVSPEVWVEGAPINMRERSDQIALKATPQILDTFLKKILADEQTDTVIFTGDNVDNGDMASHIAFRQRLEMLTAAGKKVYVVSATHDYCGAGDDENMFSAARYTETGREPIPFMRKSELFDFYYNYGPAQAISVHRDSRSYVVQLCDGVRLVMIDDNGNGRSHCGLFADGMQWLKDELEKAKADGDYVLLAVHHPVLPPWEVFRHMVDYELYGGYRDLYKLMCEENVRVVFTGHTHVQSIRKYTDDEGRWFLNVATIALANAAGKMRKVTVDAESGVCDVQSIGIETIDGLDTGGKSAFEYLYRINIPGILEKLLPLAETDYDAFLSLADGLPLPSDMLKKYKSIVRLVCRKAEKLTLAKLAHLSGAWHNLSKEQRIYAKQSHAMDTVFEVLRHIYPGNAPYTPGTPEHTVITAVTQKLDRIVARFHIDAVQKLIPPGSSLEEMVQDFLYNNRTGDDDSIRFSLR